MSNIIKIRRVGDVDGSRSEPIEDQLCEEVFGLPPSWVVGLLTAMVGAIAGLFSLLIFFCFQPQIDGSPMHWLAFIALGGIAGFFLRIEHPIIQIIYQIKTTAQR